MHPLAALRQQLAAVIAPTPELESGAPDTRKRAGIPTGILALDAALSDGGLPCGRLTEIVGERGSGKTTVVHTLVSQALADKRWVAYIDASRTLAPVDWAPLAESGRLWIVRPPPPPPDTPDHGAWCADVLLRSAAFSIVVLDGGAPLARGIAIRLTRLARESHAAFVVLRDTPEAGRTARSDRGALVGGAVRIRVTRHRSPVTAAPSPPLLAHSSPPSAPSTSLSPASSVTARREHERWRSSGARLAQASNEWPGVWDSPDESTRDTASRRYITRSARERGGARSIGAEDAIAPSLSQTFVLTLSVEKGGAHYPVEINCALDVARRLCAHSEVPDRRGVAPRNRRGERVSPITPRIRRATDASIQIGDANAASNAHGNLTPADNASGATLAHKRRCAEPVITRDEFLLPPPARRVGAWPRGCG